MEINVAGDMKTIRNYATLDEVDMKTRACSIIVRLLLTWEARNFKRDKELMSIDCLLLDEKDCLIQGSIHRQQIDRFRDSLIEGRIFLIKNFDVVRGGNKYKLTDHKYMICFTDQTSMVHVEEEKYSIQPEKFRVRSYDHYVQLAEERGLTSIHKPEDFSAKKTSRIGLQILLEEGVKVRIMIWDDLAYNFCQKLEQVKDDNIVIVVTSTNPKQFAGELYLNTTTSSKFYINAEFEIVRDFGERVCAGLQHDENHKGFVSSESSIQCRNISEILEFVSNETEQDKEFTCTAKVTDILLRNGWNYISCSKCSRKLEKSETTLKCNQCGNLQAVGVLRFRIEAAVDDGKDTATFVIFDRDAKKITSKTAAELTTIDEANGDNVYQEQSAPSCILDIVGRTFTFQIKVTSYNFRSRFQIFTVSRILDNAYETDNNNAKQKVLAIEEQSAGTASTANQDLKDIDREVSDTKHPNRETNKLRKIHRNDTSDSDSEDLD